MNEVYDRWQTTGGDTVTVYSTSSGFRWRVRAKNGEIVGTGEAHPHPKSAVAAAERHHPRVEVES